MGVAKIYYQHVNTMYVHKPECTNAYSRGRVSTANLCIG